MMEDNTDEFSDAISFTDVPHEVIEQILIFPCISISDVLNFSCVCCKFYDLSQSNEVWKAKFQQRWCKLMHCYKKDCNYEWKEECKFRLKYSREIRKNIIGKSAQHFKDEEISNDTFVDLQTLMEQHENGYHFSIDELMEILNDGKINSNLTEKYYAKKALACAKHIYLKTEFERFLTLNTKEQLAETGTILLSQWCQPTVNIRMDVIVKQIDQLAFLVRNTLSEQVKNHPVLESPKLINTENRLTESLWTPPHCKSILESINKFLFEQMDFKVQNNRDNAVWGYVDDLYIDKVIEYQSGDVITICVLYASIAHRLGVLCEPVELRELFYLRWKEHPELTDGQEYTYINVFDKGKFVSKKDCTPRFPVLKETIYVAVSPVTILQRMNRNLRKISLHLESTGDVLFCLRNSFELASLLQPGDVNSRLSLARVYLNLKINLNQVMSILLDIQAIDPGRRELADMFDTCHQYNIEAKERKKAINKCQLRSNFSHVQFAVGMVMRFINTHDVCVIHGWDPEFCSNDEDSSLQIDVNPCQPFYKVLVHAGSMSFDVAQEKLEITTPCGMIMHPEIGRYFSEYNGLYYVPNREKANEYPDDELACKELLQKFTN